MTKLRRTFLLIAAITCGPVFASDPFSEEENHSSSTDENDRYSSASNSWDAEVDSDLSDGDSSSKDQDSAFEACKARLLRLDLLTERLSISEAGLSQIPVELASFTNLKDLTIEETDLAEFPPELAALTTLTELDLRKNKIRRIPPDIGRMTQLESLRLGQNPLGMFPRQMFELHLLTQLFLSEAKLGELPDGFSRLSALEELYVAHNGLTGLPASIQSLKLRVLDVSENPFGEFGHQLVFPTTLTNLDLRSCFLPAVPLGLLELTLLTKLDLKDNLLSDLIPGMAQLTNLEELDLSKNCFNSITTEMMKMFEVDCLTVRLSENPLEFLPRAMFSLLRDLDRSDLLVIKDHQLRLIPKEVISDIKDGEITSIAGLGYSQEMIDSTLFYKLLKHLRPVKSDSHNGWPNFNNYSYAEQKPRLELGGIEPKSDYETRLLNGIQEQRKFVRQDAKMKKLPFINTWNKIIELIDISQNYINKFPLPDSNRNFIRVLILSGNSIKELSPEICILENLEVLDISQNHGIQIPEQIAKTPKLAVLKLRNVALNELHDALFGCTELKELYLDNNRLEEIPEKLGRLPKLEILSADNNKIQGVYRTMGRLTSLQKLSLRNNDIEYVPQSFGKLTNLRFLDLSQNRMVQLPPDLVKATSLTTLILKGNKLIALPDDMHLMTNLRYLFLDNNNLSEVPASLGALTWLKELSLSENKLELSPIASLPSSLIRLFKASNSELLELLPSVTVTPADRQFLDLKTRLAWSDCKIILN